MPDFVIHYQKMSARKNVTLKSVAQRAGTSIQTVSTVLNNSRSNTNVSAETRARILLVAEEMQYRRNALARSLRSGYTNIIGFYSGYGMVSQVNPFIAEVFGGIQKGCNEHRKDLLIHGTFQGTSTDHIYNELTSGKIDGLVIFSPVNNTLVRRLQAAPLPVVALADTVPDIVSIVMADIEGGIQVAQHLYALGHRHVLYRHPPSESVSAMRRLAGLREEADRYGMTVTPIATGLSHLVTDSERILLTSTEKDRPTAVVGWCDSAAKVVLQFLFDNNISVPDRIAVVGFDGFKLPFPGGAELTTMVAPWAEAAHEAVSLLVNEEISVEQKGPEIHFPMTLQRGNTT